MDSDIVGSILLQVVLIAVNAVFACAEIAVVSCNDAKLEKMAQEGNKKAAKLFRLTEQPSRFLATIQVVITLSGFLGSAFAAENFSGRFVSVLVDAGVQIPEKTLDAIAVVLITLLLSYITLIFGELVPKRLAMHNSEKIALGVSGLVTTASKIFAPLVGLLTVSTNGILRLFGIDPNEDDDQVTEEEIRMMVDAGSEKGTIDNEEKDMIQNVFEFDDLTIDEICVHRTDVDLLWVEDSIEEWEQLIHESRHSYYPVCGETVDDIIGVLDAKDYFRLRTKDRDHVFENSQFEYVQNHLRILSAFYGVLKPMDGVTPYRLEMQANVEIGDAKNLYEYWHDMLYRSVIDESRIIINLASKEYSKCIEKYLTPKDKYITISFCEQAGNKLVTKGTYAKMARGEMVRFMAENDIENPDDIKKFDRLGYIFRSDLSSDSKYVFERKIA